MLSGYEIQLHVQISWYAMLRYENTVRRQIPPPTHTPSAVSPLFEFYENPLQFHWPLVRVLSQILPHFKDSSLESSKNYQLRVITKNSLNHSFCLNLFTSTPPQSRVFFCKRETCFASGLRTIHSCKERNHLWKHTHIYIHTHKYVTAFTHTHIRIH